MTAAMLVLEPIFEADSADASSSKPAFEQHLRTEALPNFLLPGADGYRNGM
jgi:hypothetical protein